MSSVEVTPPSSNNGDELCIICDKPIRDHSFDEQKKCAAKMNWNRER